MEGDLTQLGIGGVIALMIIGKVFDFLKDKKENGAKHGYIKKMNECLLILNKAVELDTAHRHAFQQEVRREHHETKEVVDDIARSIVLMPSEVGKAVKEALRE